MPTSPVRAMQKYDSSNYRRGTDGAKALCRTCTNQRSRGEALFQISTERDGRPHFIPYCEVHARQAAAEYGLTMP